MYTGITHTHFFVVTLFFILYLIKTFLLITNKEEALVKFTKITKVPEMIISTLFLLTGIYMLTQIPVIGTLLIVKLVMVLVSIPLAVVGFKKRKKPLAVISFLLILGAFALAEINKKHPAKASATSESNEQTPQIIDGKMVYESNCVSCHGEDGKLGLLDAKDLSASTMDMSARVEIIKNGKNAMKAFGGVLTEEEVQAVATYIDTLKK